MNAECRMKDGCQKKISALVLVILTSGFWLLASGFSSPAFAQLLTPINLTTEYRSNPNNIDEARPALAWLLQSSQPAARGQGQSAYEIRVASTAELLANGHADLWQSGKVLSNDTNQVEYSGLPLGSGRECWWQVRVWNQSNEAGPWSEPATWASGMLERADWKAQWIGLDTNSMKQTPPMHLVGCQWVWTNANPPIGESSRGYFRGRFVIPEGRTVETAYLAMTASDHFQTYVNGQYVLAGQNRQTLFTRDISFSIHQGENVIAVYAENSGEYAALAGRLEIRFKQGGTETVDVDNRWNSSSVAPAGWQQPAFEGSDLEARACARPRWPSAMGPTHAGESPTRSSRLSPQANSDREKDHSRMLYTTALGDYQIHLNGQPLNSEQFSPGFSDYRRRVYYQTYDLTSQLRSAITFWALFWLMALLPAIGRAPGTPTITAANRALAQLEIDYADGSSICIPTDETWLASLGPLRQADRIMGEVYDSRQQEGWDLPLYKAAGWIAPKLGLDVPEPLIQSDLAPATRRPRPIRLRVLSRHCPANTWWISARKSRAMSACTPAPIAAARSKCAMATRSMPTARFMSILHFPRRTLTSTLPAIPIHSHSKQPSPESFPIR